MTGTQVHLSAPRWRYTAAVFSVVTAQLVAAITSARTASSPESTAGTFDVISQTRFVQFGSQLSATDTALFSKQISNGSGSAATQFSNIHPSALELFGWTASYGAEFPGPINPPSICLYQVSFFLEDFRKFEGKITFDGFTSGWPAEGAPPGVTGTATLVMTDGGSPPYIFTYDLALTDDSVDWIVSGTLVPGFHSFSVNVVTSAPVLDPSIGAVVSVDGLITICPEPPEGPCTPVNDSCASPLVLGAGLTPFSTINAHLNDGPDPSDLCGTGTGIVSDIWYEFTAPQSGTASFSTCGLVDYESMLSLYEKRTPLGQGGVCNPEALYLECSAYSPQCLGGAFLNVYVEAGKTYALRVGGFLYEQGQGALYVSIPGLPTNETCDTPAPLIHGTHPIPFKVAKNSPIPQACHNPMQQDLWWEYHAEAPGTLTVTTCSGQPDQLDSGLEVYAMAPDGEILCGFYEQPLHLIDCNEAMLSECPTNFAAAEVAFAVEPGTSYLIRAGLWFGEHSPFMGTLTASFSPLGDLDADGDVDGADLGLLLSAWGPCSTRPDPRTDCPADLNGDGAVDGADLGLLLGAWTG